MIIITKKITFNTSETSYRDTNIATCCGRMEKSPCIILNNSYDAMAKQSSYSVKLIETESHSDYEGGFDTDEDYYKIDYCPFCGSRIIVEIVKQEDKTALYVELKNKRDEMWKECQMTDSKSKAEDLRQDVRRLDKEIEDFYMSEGFK